MYGSLNILSLESGGYLVQPMRFPNFGEYNPPIAAFSSKVDLMKWLEINLVISAPDLVDRRPTAV